MQTLEKITKTAPVEGLSDAEVIESRKKHGENVLPRARGRSFLRTFLSNLGDPVIKVLLGALAVKGPVEVAANPKHLRIGEENRGVF